MNDDIPLPEALNELAKMQRIMSCFSKVSGVLASVPAAQQLLTETVAAQFDASTRFTALQAASVAAQAATDGILADTALRADAIKAQAAIDAAAIRDKATADAAAMIADASDKALALVNFSGISDASLAESKAALAESKALLDQTNAQLADAQGKLASLLNAARQGLGQ